MTPLELFLAGAHTIRDAIADPAVVGAWDQASVLEEQTVGSVAGHLARGAVWVVGDYVGAGPPDGPAQATTPAEYFDAIVGQATEDDHRGVRERGAAIAAAGPEAVLARFDEQLTALEPVLRSTPEHALIAVTFGFVLPLDVYLLTRIVEQVVHLDDLARSVDRDPFPVEQEAVALVAHTAIDLALRQHAGHRVVRALYRRGFADLTFPVF